MTTVYHEILKERHNGVLLEGLKCTERGDKVDASIARTDSLLDDLRPPELKQAGVSRINNLYCYLSWDGLVVDITNGKLVKPEELSESPKHVLLKLCIDPSRSYVSDLDVYDEVLEAVKKQKTSEAKRLAETYWQTLVNLDNYIHDGGFKRPEVMVTYDVPTDMIELV